MNRYSAIIVGAGPAGLMCAVSIGCPKVLVLEKMHLPGRKLLMSGSTRCNITHAGHIDDFFVQYGPANQFVKPALTAFTNLQLLDFFSRRKISFVTTEHGKMFPKSLKAKNILNALLDECRKHHAELKTDCPVTAVEKTESGDFVCHTPCGGFRSQNLIITTGGMSYPQTGSTGDGYALAKSLGHTIEQPRPALTPLYIYDFPFKDQAGVSLRACGISVWRANRKIKSLHGDILFTHKGLSGPGALDISRYTQPGDIVRLELIDSSDDQRVAFINRFTVQGATTISSMLRSMKIPRKLVDTLLAIGNIPSATRLGNMNREQRRTVYDLLCALPLEIKSPGGFDIAIVTAGGVKRNEINPRTLESKLHKNLYFAGEIIDVDGREGGYNLQFAFSSGCLAGQSVRRNLFAVS